MSANQCIRVLRYAGDFGYSSGALLAGHISNVHTSKIP